MSERASSRWVFTETIPGKVAEVRERATADKKLLTEHPFRDKLKVGLYYLSQFPNIILGRRPKQAYELIFVDFKASPEPNTPSPHCLACDTHLAWRPNRYQFTEGRFTYTVPQIGWWKCPDGHPGQIYRADYQRYAGLHIELADLPQKIRLKLL